jgi:hypothetical protein
LKKPEQAQKSSNIFYHRVLKWTRLYLVALYSAITACPLIILKKYLPRKNFITAEKIDSFPFRWTVSE